VSAQRRRSRAVRIMAGSTGTFSVRRFRHGCHRTCRRSRSGPRRMCVARQRVAETARSSRGSSGLGELGEPLSTTRDAKLPRAGALQDKIDAAHAWIWIARWRWHGRAPRAPVTRMWRRSRREAASRALCRLLLCGPTCCCSTSPRTISTRVVAWSSAPRRVPGHRRRHHDDPLLPRQRREVDPRARPGHGIPWRQTLWLEQKEQRLKQRKGDAARSCTLARELEWPDVAARGQQEKARLAAYDALLQVERERAETLEISIPPAAAGDLVVEGPPARATRPRPDRHSASSFRAAASVVSRAERAGKRPCSVMIVGRRRRTRHAPRRRT